MGDAWKHATVFWCSSFFALPLLLLLLLWCRGNDTRSLAACISITAFLSQLAAALEPRSHARPCCKAFLYGFLIYARRALFFPLPPVLAVLPSRAFTQIHCLNLLKFVDRKQKLINVCGRSGRMVEGSRPAFCPMAQRGDNVLRENEVKA